MLSVRKVAIPVIGCIVTGAGRTLFGLNIRPSAVCRLTSNYFILDIAFIWNREDYFKLTKKRCKNRENRSVTILH